MNIFFSKIKLQHHDWKKMTDLEPNSQRNDRFIYFGSILNLE